MQGTRIVDEQESGVRLQVLESVIPGVDIVSAVDGKTFDVRSMIKDPEDFYGPSDAHVIVRFGPFFNGLIGEYDGKYGDWNTELHSQQNITVLENGNDQAQGLMDRIGDMGNVLVKNPSLYDDTGFCGQYYDLASRGYKMLRDNQRNTDLAVGVPVSLERNGLVSTRLAMGIDRDAEIDLEVPVVTKRVHLKDCFDKTNGLAVTVKWRYWDKTTGLLDGSIIEFNDFVLASGASGLAVILSLKANQVNPKGVRYRCVSATQGGVMMVRKFLGEKLEMTSEFLSVGECPEMNDQFYLVGSRSVGDAGHAFRHFLPQWYKQ